MVEPTKFTELFEDTKDVTNNYSQLKIACDHTFHILRYNINAAKKLNKYVEMLTKAKDSIQSDLDTIQSSFDNLETNIIVYLHNHKRTQEELINISNQYEKEIRDLHKEQDAKVDNSKEFKEEMDHIVDYVNKF
jgi:hypothetical protein